MRVSTGVFKIEDFRFKIVQWSVVSGQWSVLMVAGQEYRTYVTYTTHSTTIDK